MLGEAIVLSVAALILGLVFLHFANRADPEHPRELRPPTAAAFALAGFFLALPAILWCGFLTAHPLPERGFLYRAPFLFVAIYLSVMFFWFIWNLNMYLFLGQEIPLTPWDENWGSSYGQTLKEHLLRPVFGQLEKRGHIGSVVVDAGSGAAPVSKFIDPAPGRKFIFLDIAAKERVAEHELALRFNLDNIDRPQLLSYQRAVAKAAKFLKITAGTGHADVIVLSDILNYVDYRKVILGFTRFLKPDGRIVIVNLPIRGIEPLFSPLGLKNNYELCQFLEEHRFRIESKAFPRMPKGETDESQELIVLVACKK